MTWYFDNKVVDTIPHNSVGFVYIITNLVSNRKYIGKKLFKFSKTTYKTVKLKNGSKKRKKIKSKIESDWQTYYGSSEELNKDIELLGKENFKREILQFCRSKSECSYTEAKLQFHYGVLESNEYYNGQISVRVHGSHILKS
jgi:hypothetical protein